MFAQFLEHLAMPQNNSETAFDYDVFLSHNSKDKARVCLLAERLRDAGLEVWLDEWVIRPGDFIPLAIEQGLEKARILILCLSPHALASGWVTLERGAAMFRDPANTQRRFVPLLLQDCKVPEILSQFKHVDWRQESETEFQRLLAVLTGEQTPPSADSPQSQPAPVNTPPAWLSAKLKACLADMDWLALNFRNELQKKDVALKEDLAASLLAATNLVKCVSSLRTALNAYLAKAGIEAISETNINQVKNLLGCLLLLSIDNLVLQKLTAQCCFQKERVFQLETSVPLGVELLVSSFAKRPASLKMSHDLYQAVGEYALDTDSKNDEAGLLESGFTAEAIGHSLLASVAKLDGMKNNIPMPSHAEIMNNAKLLNRTTRQLCYRLEEQEDYHYVIAQRGNDNPLHDPQTQAYIQENIPLRLMFYGEDKDTVIPLEEDLEAPVHELLTLFEKIQHDKHEATRNS